MNSREIIAEARIIRDSTGKVYGLRPKPLVWEVKQRLALQGITDWRGALREEGML